MEPRLSRSEERALDRQERIRAVRSRQRIQRAPKRLRSEEWALGGRGQIRAVPSRQRIQQVPRRLRSEEWALGRRGRIRAVPSRRRIRRVPRRSRSEERALDRQGRIPAPWEHPIRGAWAATEQRSMAETLQGCRIPEPHRSSLCRTQVALLRTQEGDSNRRTKTTKIKITDFCFISLGYRGEPCHHRQLASRSYRRLDGCRVHTCHGSDDSDPSGPTTTLRGRSASIPAADRKPVLIQRSNRRRTSILRRHIARSCRDRRESCEPVGPTERLCSGSRGERCFYRWPALWRRHALYKKCR